MHIHTAAIIDVSTERLRYANGREYDLDFVRHPGAAAVVAVDDAGRVCLVRQYRHGVEDFLWEIPAGKLDAGEPPEVCAVRELGGGNRRVGAALDLARAVPAGARHLHGGHPPLSGARSRRWAPPAPDADEELEFQWLPLAEAVRPRCCAASGTTARPRLRCGAHNSSIATVTR